MRKRLVTATILTCMVLALSACGKDKAVAQVEQKITELGSITLESKGQIEEIATLYNGLTDEQKTLVENISVYEEAQKTYDDLVVQENNRKAEEYINEGMEYLVNANGNKEELLKAAEAFENADALGNLDGSFLAGWVYDWELKEGDGQDFAKARGYYEKCEEDNPIANICSGYYYLGGQGVEQDEAKAEEYFDKAVSMLDANAYDKYPYVSSYAMGSLYERNEDEAKALECYKKAAEAGNSDAMNNIGSMYYYASGVEQDYSKAIEWFTKSADNLNTNAMEWLAYMYSNGQGVEQDYSKAIEWYKKGVELGDTTAMYYMGRIYEVGAGVEVDLSKAIEWFEKSAALNNTESMNRLGLLYYNESDYDKALEWFKKSSDAGNATSMYNIGMMYYEGETVELDYAKAKEWFEKASELDNADAMNRIGLMYRNGEGVELNDQKANEWLEKAAELGQNNAMYNLGIAYYEGKGVEVDMQKAKEWFDKAVEAGHSKDNIPNISLSETKPKDLNGEYETLLVDGDVEWYTVYFGLNEECMECDEIVDYTVEEYKAVKKDKAKWYGAVAEGRKDASGKVGNTVFGAAEILGKVTYK